MGQPIELALCSARIRDICQHVQQQREHSHDNLRRVAAQGSDIDRFGNPLPISRSSSVEQPWGKAREGRKAASPQGPATAPRAAQGVRQVFTFEGAARICPNEGVATKIVSRFALEAVDYHAIREATEQHLAHTAKALADNLNEKAMQMHMQRIVDAYVRSAHGAGTFYDGKAAQARDLTSKVANEHRDEDRPGIDNTANRAERACEFAAEVGLQAYALLAAAHGAVDAYAHVTGQDWKPYEGNTAPGRQLNQQATAARLAAFDRD